MVTDSAAGLQLHCILLLEVVWLVYISTPYIASCVQPKGMTACC